MDEIDHLVKRLREFEREDRLALATRAGRSRWLKFNGCANALEAQAKEIERLRRQFNRCAKQQSVHVAELEKVDKEIEEIRDYAKLCETNALSMADQAVLDEREACAALVETLLGVSHRKTTDAIRARGT